MADYQQAGVVTEHQLREALLELGQFAGQVQGLLVEGDGVE